MPGCDSPGGPGGSTRGARAGFAGAGGYTGGCVGGPAALPFRLAAPSCVLPAGIAENCAALAGLVPEVGLALFETEACLAYSEADLPAWLADLPLFFHAHLPLDLPWSAGLEAALAAIEGLVRRIAFLSPWALVLHPPPDPGLLPEIARFVRRIGFDPAHLLVENVPGDDLTTAWPLIRESGLGVCLDLGHVLACGQERLLRLPGLWERVAMLHAYAPGGAGPEPRHESLARLDGRGRALLDRLLSMLAPGRSVVLEVFDPTFLSQSLKCVAAWGAGRGGRS